MQELDPALLRRTIEAKLAEGRSSTTVRLLVRATLWLRKR
jgi:hypothetical protein